MRKRRVPYEEGDWFAIPLRDGGYAVGIVARSDRKGVVLGYFFGPRHAVLPVMEMVAHLKPMEAVLVRQCGDLGIIQGNWPRIGRTVDWQREQWPMPAFAAVNNERRQAWKIEYADDDISRVVREAEIDYPMAQELPPAGLAGYGAIEIILTKLLPSQQS